MILLQSIKKFMIIALNLLNSWFPINPGITHMVSQASLILGSQCSEKQMWYSSGYSGLISKVWDFDHSKIIFLD